MLTEAGHNGKDPGNRDQGHRSCLPIYKRRQSSAHLVAPVSAKTVVIQELINNIAMETRRGFDICRSRRTEPGGNDLYKEMSEAGVIDQKDLSKSKVGMVFGQMNEPPGARLRVALSALAMTEYFRDERNQDVLLLSTTSFDSRKQARKCRRC